MKATKKAQSDHKTKDGLTTLAEEEQIYGRQIYRRLRSVSKTIALERDLAQFIATPFTFRLERVDEEGSERKLTEHQREQ